MGVPPLHADVRFEIAVVESTGGGCGCRAGGGHPMSAAILLLAMLVGLRRRPRA
jgi:MYXO-CTERM domain-containing protein